MAEYDCERIIDFVAVLLSKGLIVILVEQYSENNYRETMFKQIKGKVYVKGRKCCPKPETTYDGWELNPLEFQDWWADIIVDGMLVHISINRYKSISTYDDQVVWTARTGFVSKSRVYHNAPLTLDKFESKLPQLLTLKELAILTLRHEHGCESLKDLFHCFDKTTLNTLRTPLVWWISC